MSIADIKKMSPAERLQTMEALWDVMCHDSSEPDSPDWHEGILQERKKRIESGEAKFYSISEARKRLLG
jgi:hypothetical protein